MKLITLNAWGGKVAEPLTGFLKRLKDITDIFCFQEVFSKASDSEAGAFISTSGMNKDLFGDFEKELSDHRGVFCPVNGEVYGIASFLHKNIRIVDSGEVIIYENKGFADDPNPDVDHSRKALWARLISGSKEFAVINVHGHWTHTKMDDADRIEQSRRIIALIKKLSCPVILCGDFNLRPDTESILMIERAGMRNLVIENGITSTRTALHTKSEKYADYIFVSMGVRVNDFKVLPDPVSDHAALWLDFDII